VHCPVVNDSHWLLKSGLGSKQEEAIRVLRAGRKKIQHQCHFLIIGLYFCGRSVLKRALAAGVMGAVQGRVNTELPQGKEGFERI